MQMDETHVLDFETHRQRSNVALHDYAKAFERRGLSRCVNSQAGVASRDYKQGLNPAGAQCRQTGNHGQKDA